MILHYFKIALRNILKDKIYSLINLIGLSVAIACFFLVIFWIRFEFSYENCHPNAGRIYKVMIDYQSKKDIIFDPEQIRPGIYLQLKEAFPEIEASTYASHSLATYVDEEKDETIMVDYVETTPDYLDIFKYEFIEEKKENVLKGNGYILSEELARKIFNNESAVGKTINLGRGRLCTIDAVVKMPHNTNLRFDVLSIKGSSTGIHYVMIKKNIRLSEETQQRMADFQFSTSGTENKLKFQPLKDAYFHSPEIITVPIELGGSLHSWQARGDLKQIYLFVSVSLLILAIAIISYVNTSTVRAINRMRETGIRKVIGSSKRQLIVRFFAEAFIISAVSIVVAIAMSTSLYPQFSIMMASKAVFYMDFTTVLIALFACIVITILSGGYAAFYLSAVNPVTVIQGGNHAASKERLRKILIGFQFFLSIGMLISTLLIYKQIHFMFTADTGVDSKNVIVIESGLRDTEDFIQTIKRENPQIMEATHASRAPYDIQNNLGSVTWEGMKDPDQEVKFAHIYCDHHYAATFGLNVINGEFIGPGWNRSVDIKACNLIINEAFQKLMGESNPVGITINYGWILSGEIIGVVKDFNFRPLKEPVTPLIMSFVPASFRNIYIKTTGINKKETVDYIREKYREFDTTSTGIRPVIYTAEDDFNAMYKNELRIRKMLTVFSIISLCLSVMGFFSMVSFMIEKRKKEIAIRRINGAETKDVISLFIKNFIGIIGIACVIAIPVSYFVILRWIQTYAFRTSLSWWVFILAPLTVSLITAILIVVQVFITTKQNPAEVLKMNQ